jgi:hypothetical protein
MPPNPNTTTTPNADNINHGGMRMWPLLSTASSIHFWANIFLIGALVIGVISTFFVVWMGNIKEEYLNRDIANTMERAAIAEQRAAEANEKAEEERLARVKIEEKLAPRFLNQAQIDVLNVKLKQYAGTSISIITFPGTPDIVPLSNQIVSLLHNATWIVSLANCISGTLNVPGVVVATMSEANIAVAKSLVEGLNSAGIATVLVASMPDITPMPGVTIGYIDVIGSINDQSKNPIKMLIGTKP